MSEEISQLPEADLVTETALVEAVLFMETDPVDQAAISRITGIGRPAVERVLQNLQARYEQPGHGLMLEWIAGGVQLIPRSDLWPSLRKRYGSRQDKRLSRAALETLSIIAYSQPITRAEIEAMRGVSPDGMIRLLVQKDLIAEVGRKDLPGRPVQFGTTPEFLRLFRLGSLADLPRLDERSRVKFDDVGEAEAD